MYTKLIAGLITSAQLQTVPHMALMTATSARDINTTLVETGMLDGGSTFTIPANTMEANTALLGFFDGDYLNNTGAGSVLTPRVKLGATTMWGNAFTMAQGPNRVPILLFFLLSNVNATNAQQIIGVYGGTSGPGATGSIAGTQINAGSPYFFKGSAAIDMTAAQTFDITMQHSVSSAAVSVRRHKAWLLVLPTA